MKNYVRVTIELRRNGGRQLVTESEKIDDGNRDPTSTLPHTLAIVLAKLVARPLDLLAEAVLSNCWNDPPDEADQERVGVLKDEPELAKAFGDAAEAYSKVWRLHDEQQGFPRTNEAKQNKEYDLP